MAWEEVKKIGRTFEYDGSLWASYSGAGIEFECDEGFTVKLRADKAVEAKDADIHYARYAVFADNALILDERLSQPSHTLTVELAGNHVFTVIKLSESGDSSIGFSELKGIGSHEPSPTDEKKIHVELVGDSITCGYGVEGSLSESYTTATENFTMAWGYLLAKKLGADYSAVSRSGAGLVSGYTGDGVRNSENIITGSYVRQGCTMFPIDDEKWAQDFTYSFDVKQDWIFVNLGTNDASFCSPDAVTIPEEEIRARSREFYEEYKRFLSEIRSHNPFSKIVCTLGILNSKLNGEVKMAVDELAMAGDKRIWFFPSSPVEEEDGYGTDYHPSPVSQKKLAQELFKFTETLG